MVRRLPTRAPVPGGDAGFTLLEVVVAMVLVGILASAMASLTIGSMRGLAGSRVHEQAVRIAERTMEQVRAMAFATVEAGISTGEAATDPSSEVRAGTFNGETLLQGSTVTPGTPLSPYRRTGSAANPDLVLDSVLFTVSTYPTRCWQPAADPAQCNAVQAAPSDSPVVRVSVVVTSNAKFGGDQKYTTSSLFFSPAGCMSTQTHPFSAPCQPYFYSTTALAAGSVLVHGVDASTGRQTPEILPGADHEGVNLLLGEAHANLQIEQISTVTSSLRGAEAQIISEGVVSSRSGGQVAKAQVNTDPADGTAQTDAPSPVSQSAGSLSVEGSGDWEVVVTPGPDQGSAVSTTIASAPLGCSDSSGLPVSNGQPCASATLTPRASQVILQGAGGALGLVTVADAASPSRALGVRQLAPEGSRCTGTHDVGCVAAEYSLSLGPATIGAVPSWWRDLRLGLTSLVSIDPVVVRGAAGSGQFTAGAPAPTAGLVGTPAIRFWSGSFYLSQPLSVTAETPLRVPSRPDTGSRCNVLEDGGRDVSNLPCSTVEHAGLIWTVVADLTVHPSYITAAGGELCTSPVCSAEGGQAPLISGRVMVKVEAGGDVLVDLDAEVELARVSISTIYRATPAS